MRVGITEAVDKGTFASEATIVYPEHPLYICRDPKYDILPERCLASKADFISGNKDRLTISALLFRPRIVLPGPFAK